MLRFEARHFDRNWFVKESVDMLKAILLPTSQFSLEIVRQISERVFTLCQRSKPSHTDFYANNRYNLLMADLEEIMAKIRRNVTPSRYSTETIDFFILKATDNGGNLKNGITKYYQLFCDIIFGDVKRDLSIIQDVKFNCVNTICSKIDNSDSDLDNRSAMSTSTTTLSWPMEMYSEDQNINEKIIKDLAIQTDEVDIDRKLGNSYEWEHFDDVNGKHLVDFKSIVEKYLQTFRYDYSKVISFKKARELMAKSSSQVIRPTLLPIPNIHQLLPPSNSCGLNSTQSSQSDSYIISPLDPISNPTSDQSSILDVSNFSIPSDSSLYHSMDLDLSDGLNSGFNRDTNETASIFMSDNETNECLDFSLDQSSDFKFDLFSYLCD